MKKETIHLAVSHSPAPVSPAVKAGGFVFCSGQCGYDAENGCFGGSDIETQTRGALDNLQAVLYAASSSLEQVLKVNIYLADVADFPIVNEIYKTYFTGEKPARTCLQIAKIPLGALIEIEAVALSES
ncbi:MAG: RidA family protein [Eubacteriales bacterium]|nr:RidA family protein [Eubacteriales bacterium]